MTDAHVEVDPDRCFGSGDCELALPSVFRIGDGGVAEVLPEASSVDIALLRQVASACPTSAIDVRER